jgi:hypothetical protein
MGKTRPMRSQLRTARTPMRCPGGKFDIGLPVHGILRNYWEDLGRNIDGGT